MIASVFRSSHIKEKILIQDSLKESNFLAFFLYLTKKFNATYIVMQRYANRILVQLNDLGIKTDRHWNGSIVDRDRRRTGIDWNGEER